MDAEQISEIVQCEVEKAVETSSNKLLADLDALIANRLSGIQAEMSQNQAAISLSQNEVISGLKRVAQPVFKRKGNEEQFKFNTKVVSVLEGVQTNLNAPLTEQSLQRSREDITKGINLVSQRQKMIRLADQSEAGWNFVTEYEANELADDSEDEKRILKADSRANRKLKEAKAKKLKRQTRFDVNQRTAYPTQVQGAMRSQQYGVSGAGPSRKGNCFACGKAGHFRFECGAVSAANEKISKLNVFSNLSIVDLKNRLQSVDGYHLQNNEPKGSFSIRMKNSNPNSQSALTESKLLEQIISSPVGQLNHAYSFWEQAGACAHVLSVIRDGYKLPFLDTPPISFCKNNMSALSNSDFVVREIESLIKKGCITRVPFVPQVVNPLTVAINKSGKQRLVLDCRTINLFLMKSKFKLDDIAIVKQLFKRGDYLFTFDLKSAYHHVEIFPEHRTFLGFAWKQGNEITHYVFNVLPFGVSTAAYIFTKITRVMVAYWRSDGCNIAMYMDDGCGGADTLLKAVAMSDNIKNCISNFGFLIAEEKCYWSPSNKVTWLGHVLDMEEGKIYVTDDRVDSLLTTISDLLAKITNGLIYTSARLVACVVGKLISMQSAIGPLVRLRTRCLYSCVETRSNWNGLIRIDAAALNELMFWSQNVKSLNGKILHEQEQVGLSAYSDASAIGYGGFVVENDRFDLMALWSVDEQKTSSTWRELEAVSRVLNANKGVLTDNLVQWYTDNQNVVRILEAGSKVPHLHEKALNIYDICHSSGIKLKPEWIPRGLNERADMLSKGGDCDDWEISDEAFALVDAQFGPHSIDRFASSYNCKCTRFNSKWFFVETEGIDAFAQPWEGENNWLVPPPRLATLVLQKLEADTAYGTLVVPEWKSAPF